MNLDTFKKVLPVVPVLIGALLGVGGTKAMDNMAAAKTLVEVTCIVPKPDPIKVQIIK